MKDHEMNQFREILDIEVKVKDSIILKQQNENRRLEEFQHTLDHVLNDEGLFEEVRDRIVKIQKRKILSNNSLSAGHKKPVQTRIIIDAVYADQEKILQRYLNRPEASNEIEKFKIKIGEL